jgi:hypothetical protein
LVSGFYFFLNRDFPGRYSFVKILKTGIGGTVLVLKYSLPRQAPKIEGCTQNDFFYWDEKRSTVAAMGGGGGGAQRPVLHANKPKKTGAQCKGAVRGQNPLYIVLYIVAV